MEILAQLRPLVLLKRHWTAPMLEGLQLHLPVLPAANIVQQALSSIGMPEPTADKRRLNCKH